jgi:HTH-type transcriptional regulator / antitoxin HigA
MATSISIKDLIPAFATHPGEFLLDELNARNIKQNEFALQLGIQKTQLNELLKGKRNITADLAVLLEKALQIDATFWLRAQNTFELDTIRIQQKNKIRLEAIDTWTMIKDWIAVSFFKKQNIISGDPVADLPIIKDIYAVNNYDEIITKYSEPRYAMHRKSEKVSVDKINLLAWEQLVMYNAHKLKVAKFDIRKQEQLIAELKAAFVKNKNTIDNCKIILTNYGIKMIVQSNPEKCAIDGMAFWSNGNPAIAISLRFTRIDNFAYTLLHELGHVFLHLSSDNNAQFLDVETEKNKDSKEKEADAFANECYMSKQDWREMIECYNKPYDADFKKIAKKYGLHPAMVLGKYCHTMGKYNLKTGIDKTLK